MAVNCKRGGAKFQYPCYRVVLNTKRVTFCDIRDLGSCCMAEYAGKRQWTQKCYPSLEEVKEAYPGGMMIQ